MYVTTMAREKIKRVTYSVVMNPKVKAALEKMAEKENRSLSNLIENIAMQFLEKKRVAWDEA